MEMILSKDEQNELWEFSTRLAKSKMVPQIFQGKIEDVFVTVLMGKELGISPIMALQAICVIQGTVTLKVQTMNSVVRARCPDAIIEIKIDHAKKEARVNAKRNKEDVGYESLWTMDMAKQMGLAGKSNWINQPLNMLKARALSDALRTVFPDVLLGLYSTEELSDIDLYEEKEKKIVDVTPATISDLEILESMLSKIENGETRLIKHINIKDKVNYETIDELSATQATYAINFLEQNFKKGE